MSQESSKEADGDLSPEPFDCRILDWEACPGELTGLELQRALLGTDGLHRHR